MPKPVVHFEIVGPDMAALQSFYGDLFDWEIEDRPDLNYALISAKHDHFGGIDGGFGTEGPPRTTIYMAVPDPQATLDAAVAKGSEVVMPVTEIPGEVTLALFTDPAGNMIGVVKEERPPAEGSE